MFNAERADVAGVTLTAMKPFVALRVSSISLPSFVYANPKARVFAAVVFLNDSVDYDYKYSDRQMNTCQS